MSITRKTRWFSFIELTRRKSWELQITDSTRDEDEKPYLAFNAHNGRHYAQAQRTAIKTAFYKYKMSNNKTSPNWKMRKKLLSVINFRKYKMLSERRSHPRKQLKNSKSKGVDFKRPSMFRRISWWRLWRRECKRWNTKSSPGIGGCKRGWPGRPSLRPVRRSESESWRRKPKPSR